MKTLLLALTFAAITTSAKAQSEDIKVDYNDGTLSYYYADCDSPHECTFAVVGCDGDPFITFSMEQSEVSAWFAKSNGRVLLKVGQVSMGTIPLDIRHADMDDDWWPSILPPDKEALWGMLRPGRTLEIVAGPKQLNLVIPKQIEDVRTSCTKITE